MASGLKEKPYVEQRPALMINLAQGFRAEQEYIVDVLLTEFLGLRIAFDPEPAPGSVVTIAHEGRELRLPQTLFEGEDQVSLADGRRQPTCSPLSVSREGFPIEPFDDDELPILFGAPDQNGRWIQQEGDTITLYADILGSSFFALTRLEEVGATTVDQHGRLPYEETVAHSRGFLDRPIVDEYTEVLWLCLRRLWPKLRRTPRAFAVEVSHDVDRPMAYDHASVRDRIWAVREDARSRVLPSLLGSRAVNGIAAVARLPHRDPFANFGWLMALDEEYGLKATYYFLAGGATPYDARYSIRSRQLRRLLHQVANRGHAIGLHGSYATVDRPDLLGQEYENLVAVLGEEGLPSEVTSVRQHYLRWRAPETWRATEAVGLRVDASVGFSTTVGFRAGTSFEYPVFDVVERRAMRLTERPLHVMDQALSSLTPEASAKVVEKLRTSVARHGGTLRVLWHNNMFAGNDDELTRYRDAIAPG
jgi:peptidoglycan/xylan/chitin deacetylase (PgdA/CDA1 family)